VSQNLYFGLHPSSTDLVDPFSLSQLVALPQLQNLDEFSAETDQTQKGS